MALRPTFFFFLLLLLLCLAHASTETFYESSVGLLNQRYCADRDEFTGECVLEEEDEGSSFEEEINRRVLYQQGQRYISYGALMKDMVPCKRRGQSYYNCGQRTKVNPYRRGCTVITRCARILR